MPRWFLYLNGVALLLLGLTMLTLRLREGRSLQQLQNLFSYLWALLCCAVGVLLLLMGHGHVSQPGTRTAKPQTPHTLEFPSGR